ncbi:DNA polymerase phi family protein [Acanthocheilonema viteae]
MVNVSKELLDKFYDLADFDEHTRHSAVIAILDGFEQDSSYLMERLMSGLASSRAAARLGYTNALAIILSSFGKDWPVKVLFELADEKLPLNKAENHGSILGQHLFHLAMVNSNAYNEALSEIAKREMSLAEKQSGLAYSATNLLAQCANKLREKKFAKDFWPLVKKDVIKPLDSINPEWFYFALHVTEKHSNTLKAEVSFLSASGELYISDKDYDAVINILKKATGFAENELILKLLMLAQASKNFETVYSKIVGKWLYHGDLHRVISRALPFINTMLQQIDFETDELVAIFSPEFVRLVRSVRKSNEFRFLFSTIEAILLILKESLTAKEWTSTNIAKLLNSFDCVGSGNFDEFIGGNVKITEKILLRFHDNVHDIVLEALTECGWRLRRITHVFPHWPTSTQGHVLKLLFKHGKWTEETRNAFCSSIASLFIVSVRAGRNVTTIYKDEHQKLLQKLIKKQDTGVELPVVNETLSVFMNMLTLWIATASVPNERHSYLKDLTETAAIGEKMAEDDSSDSIAVLNDLLLSLLSRPHRYHRSVIHYVFASFVPRMKLENLLQILQTINLSNEELMQEKDTSESDDENDKDENSYENSEQSNEENEVNGNITDQHEETDESEFEEKEDEESEVDEDFVNSLKIALGSAAARSDDDSDKDSLSSTVSDETMFRLDEGLAAVFRKRMKNSRALSAFLIEQAQQFRAKCFDLLLIAVSHQEGTYKTVDLILPLVECAQQALRRKDGELTFKKAANLLEIIIKHKKSELNEKNAIKLLDELVLKTSQTINPIMRNILGNVASFLFSGCYDAKENVVAASMRLKVIELLEKYMNDSKNQILSEIVTAPFIKYPHALLSELPRIIEFAFDENIRAFQRVGALSCAVAFLRKDLQRHHFHEIA